MIYFPSYATLGVPSKRWNLALSDNFGSYLDVYKPIAVVFDGTFIYHGIYSQCFSRHIPLLWLQRGCWRRSVSSNSDQYNYPERYSDMVLVPGDYGEPEENDSTAGITTLRFNPVIGTPPEKLVSRKEACEKLGLDPKKKFALIQLGAGTINNTEKLTKEIITALRQNGFEAVITTNPASGTPSPTSSTVTTVEAFPIAPYYRAFDCLITAAGYNSIQEAVSYGIKTLAIPNLETVTDDQALRLKNVSAFSNINVFDHSTPLTQQMQVFLQEIEAAQASPTAPQKHTIQPNGAMQIADFLDSLVDGIKAGQGLRNDN